MAPQRNIIKFKVDNRIVYYFDKVWGKGLQVLPKNPSHILKMKRSGKQGIQFMVALILDANKGENLREYRGCQTDEEVAEFVIKDCKLKGIMEVKRKK